MVRKFVKFDSSPIHAMTNPTNNTVTTPYHQRCPKLEGIGFHVFVETELDRTETTVPIGMVFDEDGGSSVEEEVRTRRTLFAAECKYCGEMMLEESVQNYDLPTLLEDQILTEDVQYTDLDTP
jgi:hypothetical protein